MQPLPALLTALALGLPALPPLGGGPEAFTRTRDVIYGRKYGLALTMDVFAPKKDPNGLGLIWVVSGGWFSAPGNINAGTCKEFLDRGYTVFCVVHGSQPRFTIPEVLEDLHRAVRYVRHHARDYKVDPDRLGIMGGSAGGKPAGKQRNCYQCESSQNEDDGIARTYIVEQ